MNIYWSPELFNGEGDLILSNGEPLTLSNGDKFQIGFAYEPVQLIPDTWEPTGSFTQERMYYPCQIDDSNVTYIPGEILVTINYSKEKETS